MVVIQGVGLALRGVAIGGVVAFFSARVLRSFLFGVSPADPVTLGLVPFGVVAAAIAACYLPARRATRVDPVAALRGDL